ncbi:toll-like receptor 21 [Corythoichthys intestinalis]|uniref:toll-like receptor 21 n=1 Tax=Corythoichthys intestinalis TaxID=161448 RepID=UPI0025A53483|nr:toll-like receptor 21 [Corythoichthys intestinalis]
MAALVCHLSLLMLILVAVQMVVPYTFKNCVELRNTRKRSFKCTTREWNISVILEDLPPSVINLTILASPIKDIPDKAFVHIKDLQHLELGRNRLRTISDLSFDGLNQLKFLDLSFNNISQLRPKLFANLHNLTFLTLSGNHIKSMPVDIFSTRQHMLDTLILQSNRLTNFSEIVEAVSYLKNLKELNLCQNNLTSLLHSNISLPQSLTKLVLCKNNLDMLGCGRHFFSGIKILDLSLNSQLTTEAFQDVDLNGTNYLKLSSTKVNVTILLNISNIKAGHIDFTGTGVKTNTMLLELCKLLRSKVKSLNTLRLSNNSITNLQNDTLSQCPTIRTALDLSNNNMGNAQNKISSDCLRFIGKNKYLRKFYFEHNHLTSIASCKNVTLRFNKMEELSLRYNRILSVDSYAFYHTPNIKTLKLNINIIAFLHHEALKGLYQLENLRLDNNLLTDLFADTFEDLIVLQSLNLRNNRIAVIFNGTFLHLENLTTLDLGGNKISHIEPSGFQGLRSLSKLYLDGNNLKQIHTSLHGAFLDTLTVLDLERNLIMFPTKRVPSPFVKLSRLNDLKLGGQRPYGLTRLQHKFFRGLRNLTSLYLANNQISYIAVDAFDDLTNLIFLTLQKCCVVNIELKPGIFNSLRKLSYLSAENAGFQTFSRDVFGNLTGLQTLQLNHNGMQTLDVDVLESMSHLRYLDIRNLSLSCTCQNSLLQNWTMKNQQVQVVYLYDLPCQQGENNNFYNFNTDVCYVDLGKYLFFTTSTVVVLFTSFPLLYVLLYWKMKYGYYVFRAWFSEQWRKIKEEEENCTYDAFVSYNSSDEQWVMVQLLPNLEGNGSSLKLCLHHRDFEPGRDIVDNIVNAVYSSRKTICVISRNFLQSEWCSLEIQLASYRLFDEHRDVLLLIFLEPVSERQMSSYHRMRKVMLKKTYLQWPGWDCLNPEQAQELFWNKLRHAVKTGSKQETEEYETQASPNNDDLGDSDTQTLIPDGNYYTY